MSNIRTIFPKYFSILEENRTSKYLNCKNIPVSYNKNESTLSLWKKHHCSLEKWNVIDNEPETSLLDLKIELANRIFQDCIFCERRCKVDRRRHSGNCKVKKAKINSEFLHIGEENILVPSYTIFFSGCTFHCVFCQNWDISQVANGIYIKPERVAEIIQKRSSQDARNVNWVGGDPTPNLLYILEVLKICNVNMPQIWNSNMYCSIEAMNLLNNVIDLYLTDFKYGNDKCARRLSKVENYCKIIKRNHKIAHENGEMIIRHLVMPNHINCCSKPIIKWISENLLNASVNIMAQYKPEYHAYEYEDITGSINVDEYLKLKDYSDELGVHQI